MSLTNKETPLVSIVIPCYNHAQFVQETIQSVIDQDYDNIELIIIDDGSKDNSVEVIQEMIPACEERFKRFEFRYRPNKGLCATLNEALEWCEGEYFAPLASDDMIDSNKTKIQVKYLIENLQCAAVFSGAKVLNSKGEVVVERPAKYRVYFFKDIILNMYSLFTPSQLIRLDLVREVNGFNPDVMLEDWYIYLKLSELGYTLDSIEGVVVSYRRHLGNTTNNVELMHIERLKVLSLFKGSEYYESAMIEYFYTKSRELVPYSKIESLRFLIFSISRKLSIAFRSSTLKLIVKFFIPKSKLLSKQEGS